MNCPENLQIFLNIIDDKLSPSELKTYNQHIINCEHCKQTLNNLKDVSPQSTRAVFDQPISPVEILPFPDALCPSGTQSARFTLRSALQVLAENFQKNCSDLVASLAVIPLQPVSSVREPHQQIQMDLVNLTDYPLDESALHPHICQNSWSLSGFHSAFAHSNAYLMIIPVNQLMARLPGWNRQDSQSMIHAYLDSGGLPESLTGIAVLQGEFQLKNTDLQLHFHVTDELHRLIMTVDRTVTAIVLL